MNDLSKVAGFPLALEPADIALLSPDFSIGATDDRTLEAMRPFLVSSEARAAGSFIYRVFRDIQEGPRIAEKEIHYDITLIPPGVFSFTNGPSEFFRTAGHYHGTSLNKIGFPEIYETLSGLGRWLIQKPGPTPEIIKEAYMLEAGPGEKILVPPGFGHITVNAENTPLLVANAITTRCKYDYAPYQKLGGGCWRFLASSTADMIELSPNPRYTSVSQLKKLRPKKDWLKGYFLPLWDVLRDEPDTLAFLSRPESYSSDFFSIQKLYQEIR